MDDMERYQQMFRDLDNCGATLTEILRKMQLVQNSTEELIEGLDETTESVRPALIKLRHQTAANLEQIHSSAMHFVPGKELAEFNQATESLRTDDPFTQIVNQDDK